MIAGDRQLADHHVVVGDHERQRPTLASLPAQVADQRPIARCCARSTPAAGSTPTAPSQAALSRRSSAQRAASRDVIGRSPTRPSCSRTGQLRAQLAPPSSARGWSPPRIWSSACSRIGVSTARPSFTPPTDPGRLTIKRATGDTGEPARQAPRSRCRCRSRTRGSRRRCPGTSQSSTDARHLRRPVGRGETGTAGRHDQVDAALRRPPAERRAPAHRRARSRCRPRRSPGRSRACTIRGPVVSSYTPAAARFEIDSTNAVLVASSLTSGRPRRLQSPLRPPDLLSTLMSPITAVLVDGLDHVDDRKRGDRHRSQRLHLDAGAIGRADRRGDLDGIVERPRGRPRPRSTRAGGRAAPGRGSSWQP